MLVSRVTIFLLPKRRGQTFKNKITCWQEHNQEFAMLSNANDRNKWSSVRLRTTKPIFPASQEFCWALAGSFLAWLLLTTGKSLTF